MYDRYCIVQTISSLIRNEYVIQDRQRGTFLHTCKAGAHALWTPNLSTAEKFHSESAALLALTELLTGMTLNSTHEALKIDVVQLHWASDITRFFSRVSEHLFHVFIGATIICGIIVVVRIIGQFLWGW